MARIRWGTAPRRPVIDARGSEATGAFALLLALGPSLVCTYACDTLQEEPATRAASRQADEHSASGARATPAPFVRRIRVAAEAAGVRGEQAPADTDAEPDSMPNVEAHPASSAEATRPTLPELADFDTGAPDLSIVERCSAATLRGAATGTLQRLSRTELLRLLQRVFPSLWSLREFPATYRVVSLPGDVMIEYPRDVADDPNENFNGLHSEAQVSAWMDVADAFGGLVAASKKERESYGGKCMQAESIDAACWTGFVTNLGRAVFRRPLTPDEVAAIVAEVPEGEPRTAIQSVVARMLRAPSAVFHAFLGSGASDEPRARLTDHEVAERLAFGLTSAPPDALLALAADNGELGSLAELQVHATRLMLSPGAIQRVRDFIGEWLRVDNVVRPPGTETLEDWPQNTAGLDRMYVAEINAFADYVIFTKRGTFTDLLTLPVAFPDGRKLADVYRVHSWTRGMPTSTPGHPGLLLRAGFLASGHDSTSPILRGVTLLRRALCQSLPSPDSAVVATRLIALNTLDPRTTPNHEIVRAITSPAHCMACHSLINPVGFLLEAFDPLGRIRTVQTVVLDHKPRPKHVVTFALPGPQMLSIGELAPAVYAEPAELMHAIAESRQAHACMAVRLFRSIHQRREQDADACAIAEVVAALAQGKPLVEVFGLAVANEDIFWRRSDAD